MLHRNVLFFVQKISNSITNVSDPETPLAHLCITGMYHIGIKSMYYIEHALHIRTTSMYRIYVSHLCFTSMYHIYVSHLGITCFYHVSYINRYMIFV